MGETLPPGTQRLESLDKTKLLLCPRPSSDPNQPLRWSKPRKYIHMAILSFYGIMMFAVITAQPPMWEDLGKDLGLSYDQLNNGYATSQGTQTIACIFMVPLALKYGRRPVYILTSLIMLASCIWFAMMRNYGDLVGANILCGIASVVNEALFQMTICDVFYVHQRGRATGLFLIMATIGNYLGPVAVGYVTLSQGWRWAFWYCTIFVGLMTLLVVFCLEETKYHVPFPALDAQAIAQTTADESFKAQDSEEKLSPPDSHVEAIPVPLHLRPAEDIDPSIPMKSYRERLALYSVDSASSPAGAHFVRHLYQPFQILFTFPAVFFAAIQYGWVITMLVTLAVTQAELLVRPPYDFSSAGLGLMNIPPCIGAVLGALVGGALVDHLIVAVAKRRGGIYEPETRLWLFIVPGLAMVVGVLVFGLTIAQEMPWIINAVGAAFIGFALGGCGDIALAYLQDSYQGIMGDALVGVVFVRNGIATAFIFALPPWMEDMGVYNMYVVMGCLAAVMALAAIPLIVWGRTWRVKLAGRYEWFAERQN